MFCCELLLFRFYIKNILTGHAQLLNSPKRCLSLLGSLTVQKLRHLNRKKTLLKHQTFSLNIHLISFKNKLNNFNMLLLHQIQTLNSFNNNFQIVKII